MQKLMATGNLGQVETFLPPLPSPFPLLHPLPPTIGAGCCSQYLQGFIAASHHLGTTP